MIRPYNVRVAGRFPPGDGCLLFGAGGVGGGGAAVALSCDLGVATPKDS